MVYPNLAEIIKYHPYHIGTFAGFADVTAGLLEAAVRGEEELTSGELYKIARYSGIPHGVICHPHLIRMDRHSMWHREMVKELCGHITFINDKKNAGSHEAETFMRYYRGHLVNLELAFLDGRATYGQYLGVKERVEQTLSFIRNEERGPRGLEGRAEA